jgi:Zn finger protein HypA/HybF involved in hydrogenase expression
MTIYGVIVLAVLVVILWDALPKKHYCKNCGQDLGKGDPPETCPKCGSNRFTREDPGVGKAVKIKQIK